VSATLESELSLRLGALVLLGCIAAASHAASPTVPALALTACRLQHPDHLQSIEARCGVFAVPEDRNRPASRRIELKVAVIAALDRRGAADPLFILAGGPGQAATDFYALIAPAFARVQRERDIVLVDQRGTGGSNALNCPFPDEDKAVELTPQQLREHARSCLAALHADPRYYTSSVAVQDLDAVRAALGYRQINLYGVSYGTRVAQHYLRRFPDHTRAVILDGVVPPDAVLVVDGSLQAQRALDLIFARCNADSTCHAAFTDPRAQFEALRTRLTAAPARVSLPDPDTGTVTPLELRLPHLQIATRLLSYAPSRAALLPLILDQAVAHDNLVPLAAQAVIMANRYVDVLSYGMHNAVVCTEDVPFIDTARIDRTALQKTYLGTAQLDGLIAVCQEWPRGPIDADFHAPLVSDRPVLLLSGSVDPVTPPQYAERAARGLSNKLQVVLEGQGHGQLATGCVPRLMARFLELGTPRGLEISCTSSIAPDPFFTSFAGPPP
jgi:pimeloyl-ACP methyl ester carboxylesterase